MGAVIAANGDGTARGIGRFLPVLHVGRDRKDVRRVLPRSPARSSDRFSQRSHVRRLAVVEITQPYSFDAFSRPVEKGLYASLRLRPLARAILSLASAAPSSALTDACTSGTISAWVLLTTSHDAWSVA